MTANKALMVLMLSLAGGVAFAAPSSSLVDFSHGAQGWEGMQPADGLGGSGIDTSMGNGAPALRTVMENFGISFSNSSNQSYLGDYGKLGSVTIGIDVLANSIRYFNQEVSRHMVVELRDYGNTPQGMPYTSVWYDLGTMDYTKGWQHMSVTISDTTSSATPTGWGGYGSPDDADGPGLPPGRSFADVLSSVDELVFTTYVPGYMYGYTDYDVVVDNIAVTAVPEPSTYAMLLGGLGLVGWRTRRKTRAAATA
jgi:hypothetical protein